MSLSEKLAQITCTWEGNDFINRRITIQEAVSRLETGVYPVQLWVYRPDVGRLQFARASASDHMVSRYGPTPPDGTPLQGIYYGVWRIRTNTILDLIKQVFVDVSNYVNLKKSADPKLLKLRVEGARKMMNSLPRTVPRNVQNLVTQMIGEKMPVSGAYSVPDNMTKINTTLFQGGKRKTRRNRRKSTRRRR